MKIKLSIYDYKNINWQTYITDRPRFPRCFEGKLTDLTSGRVGSGKPLFKTGSVGHGKCTSAFTKRMQLFFAVTLMADPANDI